MRIWKQCQRATCKAMGMAHYGPAGPLGVLRMICELCGHRSAWGDFAAMEWERHYRDANQAKRRAEEALQHVPF